MKRISRVRRTVSAIVLCIMMSTLIIGCGKSGNNIKKDIVGTFITSSDAEAIDIMGYGVSHIMTFYENGTMDYYIETFTSLSTYEPGKGEDIGFFHSGSYEIDTETSKIRIVFDDSQFEIPIKILDGNKTELTYEYSEDGKLSVYYDDTFVLEKQGADS